MNNSPAFQFYPGDFLSDANTLVMSAEEVGAYWLLICACWKEDGLPVEIKKLARLARLQEKKFSRLWENAISICFYFDEKSGKYRHRRLDQEIEKQALNSAKRQKAANARWMQMHSKCIPDANQVECSSSSSSSSSSEEEIHVSPATATPAEAPRESSPEAELEIKQASEAELPPSENLPAKSTPKAPRQSESFAPAIREIFAYWQAKMTHPDAKLTDKRRRLIEGRLREGYTVERIKRAIDGCKSSPWHMGTDPKSSGQVFDDIELICRSGEKLESFEARNSAGIQTGGNNGNHRNGTASPSAANFEQAAQRIKAGKVF